MRKIILLHIILLFSVLAWAQTPATGLPYECSFEESEILSAWTLNPLTPTAADKWMIGDAVHSEGRRALYVSTNGQSPSYSDRRNVVVAYLTYKFPSNGSYDISFDWRGMGSNASSLHVMVCPLSELTRTGSQYELSRFVSSTQQMPNNMPLQMLGDMGETSLYGAETWQNTSLTQPIRLTSTAASTPFAIVFIWENQLNVKSDTTILSGFAIDNVQINSAALKKPTELVVVPHCEDSTLIVNWVSPGAANEFDVQYRKVGTPNWRNAGSGLRTGTTGFTMQTDAAGVRRCSYIVPRILEGSYDVRVRASYDGDLRTGWTYESLILVYCPENHCINYIDLHNPSVICTYGYHPNAHAGATPYDNIGIIDFGPDAEESRHTLHVDPTELDPRTDSMLNTVPDGALASVRLGNWKWGGEAESITYDILVDTAHQGLLIVKYAIVFENPGGHPPEDEPAFTLEILNENGQVIDDLCGQASFTFSDGATEGAAGWHMTKDGKAAWKEWTTVGLSLMGNDAQGRSYHGQTIKVRFTTYDCGWSGHYGYAYFTVDCANAHIETDNCGNDARITCKAPDGFAYEWRNELGEVVSREQELDVDASRQTYTCRVSFIEQPACYFEISTLSAPRFPVPEYTWENLFGECRSELKITNTSHVMNKFQGFEDHTAEECNDWHWEFRRLSNGEVRRYDAKEPRYLCPSEGDSIEVTYTCYIGAENSCDSTRVDTIVVPNIIPESTEIHYTTCSETPYKFDGKWFERDTVYVASFPNFAGCDSTSTLYLKFYPKPADLYRHDSICSDQSIVIEGKTYNQPLEDYLIMLKTIHGCDSAIYLTLTVNERLQAHVDQPGFACADDMEFDLTYDITAGVYDSLQISFSTPLLRDTMIYDPYVSSVTIPYPADILPGRYTATLTFYQFCCGLYVEERDIDIRYRSSIVEQKWNDVLTLLNPKYNGGYEFTAFQWYKDGMPLEGENHSYLYQPLDTTSTYYVVVTRPDGVSMATCPIQPIYHPQQSDYPTIVPAGQHMPMYMAQPTSIWYYTMSGQLYSSFSLPQGYTSLPTPDQAGVYLIRAVDAQGEAKAQVMIVQ